MIIREPSKAYAEAKSTPLPVMERTTTSYFYPRRLPLQAIDLGYYECDDMGSLEESTYTTNCSVNDVGFRTCPPYFVTTLGQAKYFNTLYGVDKGLGREDNITALIDSRAESYPDVPIVGEFLPPISSSSVDEWTSRSFNFSQLAKGTSSLALHMMREGIPVAERLLIPGDDAEPFQPPTVALLCPSSVDFLFHWLSLMRLGYAVLLLAPQLNEAQICHLYQSTSATHLFYHDMHATQIHSGGLPSKMETIPLCPRNIYLQPAADQVILPAPGWITSRCTAYIHHTSGTSSGQPKPIPQSHAGATTCLPQYLAGAEKRSAQFTTTPLYHGGIADLMRGINSLNLTWLYPSTVPVTSSNLVKMFAISSEMENVFHIKYFSSVPYVLNFLAESKQGMHWLKAFKMVGVGGAPLDAQVGNKLVNAGVRLVSRYGSTEAGFLLSSFREFDKDLEWEYLRCENNFGGDDLVFEEREETDAGKTYELIVGAKWPNLSKRNLPDGSFATSDIFLSGGLGNWKYINRNDVLLVLDSGKKFDPIPIESSIVHHPLISSVVLDVCLFVKAGNTSPGVLISHNAPKHEYKALRQKISYVIRDVNTAEGNPRHAWIPEDQIILKRGVKFPKSSKGTILRTQVMELYGDLIDKRFSSHNNTKRAQISRRAQVTKPSSKHLDLSRYELQKEGIEDLVHFVGAVVRGVYVEWNSKVPIEGNNGEMVGRTAEIVAKRLQNDTDLFSFGVDSVMAVEIRSRLSRALNLDPSKKAGFGMNVVFEQRTIVKLAKYIMAIALGDQKGCKNQEEASEEEIMWKFVEKYTTIGKLVDQSVSPARDDIFSGSWNDDQEVMVLTGATGSLGAHILKQYCKRSISKRKIYCLVRGNSVASVSERVERSLRQRGFSRLPTDGTVIVKYLPAAFEKDKLGLQGEVWREIKAELARAGRNGVVIHAAWPVNFAARVESFEPQFEGIIRLLELLPQVTEMPSGDRPQLAFISSTASVSSMKSGASSDVQEIYSSDPRDAAPLGYSRSKWVAEKICQYYGKKGLNVKVIRVGQLCGDTRHGYWNQSEGWPLMLAVGTSIKALPDLRDEVYWLPVDIAASIVLEITSLRILTGDGNGNSPSVEPPFHVLNPRGVWWSEIFDWMKRAEKKFSIVSPEQWVKRVGQWVERLEIEKETPWKTDTDVDMKFKVAEGVRGLLNLWEEKYGNDTNINPKLKKEAVFATDLTSRVSPAMKHLLVGKSNEDHSGDSECSQPLNQASFHRILRRWEESGFL
ncbi:hypothetical protein EV426DRAFT_612188 [Tirmania nivea]|nr:hypothetical protein EV426DRAFT_612188 [Tirmania nivea]